MWVYSASDGTAACPNRNPKPCVAAVRPRRCSPVVPPPRRLKSRRTWACATAARSLARARCDTFPGLGLAPTRSKKATLVETHSVLPSGLSLPGAWPPTGERRQDVVQEPRGWSLRYCPPAVPSCAATPPSPLPPHAYQAQHDRSRAKLCRRCYSRRCEALSESARAPPMPPLHNTELRVQKDLVDAVAGFVLEHPRTPTEPAAVAVATAAASAAVAAAAAVGRCCCSPCASRPSPCAEPLRIAPCETRGRRTPMKEPRIWEKAAAMRRP
mmetsp:Transcript_60473/g.168945  ORF Transcript_60473/g.168945 Transcript_60473/m.168945 type:complete len:270 (+) Transcript_60473:354-1163(+)